MGLVSTSNNAPASEARPGGRSKVWSRREQAGEERVQRRKREGRSARLFQGGGGAIIDAPSPDQREQRSLLDARAVAAACCKTVFFLRVAAFEVKVGSC